MTKGSLATAVFAIVLAGCGGGPEAGGEAAAPAQKPATAAPPSASRTPQAQEASPDAGIPTGFKPFLHPDGRISQGRCHMDACTWTKWQALEIVNASKDEVELKATVVGGESDHAKPDRSMPDYPDSADGVDIRWNPESDIVEYRCSKTRPAMKWGDEPRTELPLNPDFFIPGAMEAAVRSYFVACHSDFAKGTGEEGVAKYGYRAPTAQ